MKKIVLAAMILGMAGILGTCSMDGDGASKTTGETVVAQGTSQEEKGQKEKAGEGEEQADTFGAGKPIAGIMSQEDQFFKLMLAGYEATAKDLGYEVQLSNVTDGQTKETELVNTYITQRVAGIAISPLSATIPPEALKVSSDEGVKICMANAAMDSYPFSIATYTSDNYAFCKQTGEIAADFIKEKYGNEKIELGTFQFKTQILETPTERINGFLAALDEGRVNYGIISNQDAWLQDTVIAKAGDMLAANLDIDIMSVANDGGTIGAAMTVENAGQAGKTFVFGTDASEQIADLLRVDSDTPQVVTGQDSFQIGYETVEALIQSIGGKDVADQGKTVIVGGVPLRCDDIKQLDNFTSDLKSRMQLSSLSVGIRDMP